MAAGFSINILTLFALVLAIGTVVDDAMVVVEAVQSKFDVGYKSSYLATKDAMGDVTMAIISCTCVFWQYLFLLHLQEELPGFSIPSLVSRWQPLWVFP